jgi:hypothetical protein
MSATKKLHPDEKIKADKVGGTLFGRPRRRGAVLLASRSRWGGKGDHWPTLHAT